MLWCLGRIQSILTAAGVIRWIHGRRVLIVGWTLGILRYAPRGSALRMAAQCSEIGAPALPAGMPCMPRTGRYWGIVEECPPPMLSRSRIVIVQRATPTLGADRHEQERIRCPITTTNVSAAERSRPTRCCVMTACATQIQRTCEPIRRRSNARATFAERRRSGYWPLRGGSDLVSGSFAQVLRARAEDHLDADSPRE